LFLKALFPKENILAISKKIVLNRPPWPLEGRHVFLTGEMDRETFLSRLVLSSGDPVSPRSVADLGEKRSGFWSDSFQIGWRKLGLSKIIPKMTDILPSPARDKMLADLTGRPAESLLVPGAALPPISRRPIFSPKPSQEEDEDAEDFRTFFEPDEKGDDYDHDYDDDGNGDNTGDAPVFLEAGNEARAVGDGYGQASEENEEEKEIKRTNIIKGAKTIFLKKRLERLRQEKQKKNKSFKGSSKPSCHSKFMNQQKMK
jgi:hypothetical protein